MNNKEIFAKFVHEDRTLTENEKTNIIVYINSDDFEKDFTKLFMSKLVEADMHMVSKVSEETFLDLIEPFVDIYK